MGSECLSGKSDLKDRVKKALDYNKELSHTTIFGVLNGAKKDPLKFAKDVLDNNLAYPSESVSRAVRKAREEMDALKDSNYFKRQKEASHVEANISKDTHYNDYHVKQGSML